MKTLLRGALRVLISWFFLSPALLLAGDALRINFAHWQTNDWQIACEPKTAQPGRWTQETDCIRAGDKDDGLLNLLCRSVNAADVTVEARMAFTGDGAPSLLLRAQENANEVGDTYFVVLHKKGINLWRRVNGLSSKVAQGVFAPDAGKVYRVRASAEGWRLRVWVDDVLQVDVEDATIPMSGRVGLWAGEGVCRFHGFSVETKPLPDAGIETPAWLNTGKVDEKAWSKLGGVEDGKLTWGSNSSEKRIESAAGGVRVSARANNVAESHYVGVMLPVPVRDVRKQQLLLDLQTSTPDATSSIYVRLYDAAGKRVGSWNGHPHLPASVPVTLRLAVGAGYEDFGWESKEIKGEASAVTKIELIAGTRQPNAIYDLIAGNLRTTPAPPSVRDLTKVKPLFLETPLVAGGRAVAAIVTPAKYRDIAGRLQSRIHELTGADVPVLDDASLADAQGRWNAAGIARRSRSLIALGNFETNRLLPLLYARFYTAVDAFYPGQGGHALHTIHDPWGNGHNIIVAGGSDDDGVRAAADALLAELSKRTEGKDLSLPRLMQLKLSPALLKAMPVLNRKPDEKAIAQAVTKAKEAFARGQHTGVTGHLYDAGFNYYRSGNDGYAELFKRLARLMIEIYRSKPTTYGGPWGMDADFNSMQVIAAWDLVEESPVFTDAERLEVTRIIAEYACYLETFGNFQGTSRQHIRHNHNTFPALGVLFAADYFGKYYRVAEAARWLATADACFQPQALSFKAQEDSNGYQWLTVGHLMRYALARPDHTYFANGNARRTLDLAVSTMDNLGFQSAFGDVGGWRGWASEVPLWNIGTWYFREPSFRWAVEQERAVQPYARITIGGYETASSQASAPKGFDGMRVFPIERKFYDYWAPPATNGVEKLWLAPLEQTYEKVSFRGGFDPQQPYLLLDGIGCGGHRHYDGNSLVRYSERGREWFADGDYIKALPKFHTSVLVFRDGQSSTLPPFCALETHADLPSAGFARSTVRNYGAADWSRNLVWLKGRCFVAIDSLKARAADEYSFRTVWHTLGEPKIEGSRFTVEQNGERCVIENLDGARLKLTDDESLGKNWSGYTNAQPVVRILQQIAGRKMKAGESHHFLNVFGASPFTSARASDTSVLVSAGGETTLVGVTDGKRCVVAPGIETDAALFALRPSGFSLAKATTLVAGGRTLFRANAPVAVEFDAGTGRTVVESAVRVTIALAGESERNVAPGRQEFAVSGLAVISLPTAAPAKVKMAAGVAHAPQLPVRWKFSSAPFTCIAAADLDGDKKSETVGGASDGRVCCVGADGKQRWEFKAPSAVKAIWAGDLGGDGGRVVAAGLADGSVCLLDATGKQLWSHAFPYYKRKPVVAVVFAADLNGDGRKAIIAGTESWHFYALDRGGNELWHYESVHGSTCGVAADLDGDGKQEVIAGTEYYWWHAITPDGKRRWGYSTRTGPHANCVAAGDLGGGKRAVVFGGADGNLHVLGADGKPLWLFNTGDEVTGVAVASGRVYATSMSFNLYALDGDGKQLWRRDRGDVLRGLALIGSKLAVGGEDGRVAVFSSEGVLRGEAKLDAPVTQLSAVDLDGDGRQELVVLNARGEIVALGNRKD
ncbi:MAG: PQQ-binding-like beta-propeller repeat protein [Verrucomicrobia bacterium]|nr:PQQ-binding-like beta-propeller repeat protein [Verrucomicrobiota bacterium]